jgi:hypothetical protein
MKLATHQPGLADRFLHQGTGNRLPSVQDVEPRYAERQLEDLWDRHGRSVYALACTLLRDQEAATQAVRLGMTDLAHSTDSVSAKEARRSMARHVYWRSQGLASQTPKTLHLPPAMVWLGQLAQLQRACLALCVFGGHTYQEAAGLLGVPPNTVAELLTAGLREVGRLLPGGAPATA